MKTFMDENFLLNNEPAQRLYHIYAAKMPIIDYHCHINPQEIYEDKHYTTVSEPWLYGDHYKWRLMRANGVPESAITGARDKNPEELFMNFAAALPKAAGNAIYHWTHLELQRYFNIKTPLNEASAKQIYDECNKKLEQPGMGVRGLIAQSNVELICTTDDPADSLEWHAKIKADVSCTVKVLPAFRPDKAMNIEKEDFGEYINTLSAVAGVQINSFDSLCAALAKRIDFFNEMGCRAADHGLESVCFAKAQPAQLDDIFKRAMANESLNAGDGEKFRTAMLVFLAACYAKYGWVMQLHFGCMRDNNSRMFKQLGPDTGFDAMNANGRPQNLAPLLNEMNEKNALPRTVLYSLNPTESEIIATIAGCFMADAGCRGKIQLGAAWWFNDTKPGMEKQLSDYAVSGLLGNFVGMLTDSRSFLSYTRHEYFRRILCNFLGTLVENGEYPADFEMLGKIVEDICYNNTKEFFGFEA